MNSRRNFIKTSAVGAAGITLANGVSASVLSVPETKRPIHVFTKCLQFLNYDEIAEVLAKNGFDGADLAVRTGGQVLPENVETDLPKAVKALRKAGVDSNMIVTKINDADDPFAARTLKTMADLGIKYYRMGYLAYDDKKSIVENLDMHKTAFEKLETLNRKYNVHGGYQNHSGQRVGGPVWDLYHLLKDRDPEFIGVQYDVRHATAEGGISWPIGMKLLAPWIKTTDIKDFIWAKNEKGQWKVKNVPLGEGMVDYKTYFELYKSLNIEAPVSIHYEYDLGGAEHGDRNPTMSLEEINLWLKKDITFLKNQFEKYGL
ncbi:MAG: TIM barrel protein [Prolixibacteraceae bacterium]|jgi:L-ribulose-5-phosphate 3-epimerase|nr:TIM barrel protein [Prolixibacteraceae bacterium]MBT6004969.1 TIM barrel protein [Prolixibacteraceae bacterium]MBT6764844.1 TIM barrel protein [Prolixibacteraceae bacterium]MBT6998124.1 TIM barrel protein [Prolixibacteraceae bacterium]MBT7393940.1 TIM barrel protein [Prolixibacteraceae bacterium]